MSDRETISELLAQLRLRGMAQALEGELERAEHQPCSPAQLVYRLLLEEARYRRERSLEYRLDQAKLPWPWTLESFPFERQPGLDRAQVRSLASLDFVRPLTGGFLVQGGRNDRSAAGTERTEFLAAYDRQGRIQHVFAEKTRFETPGTLSFDEQEWFFAGERADVGPDSLVYLANKTVITHEVACLWRIGARRAPPEEKVGH